MRVRTDARGYRRPVRAVGGRRWVVADGYIPAWSQGPAPEFTSHDAACILNAGPDAADIRLTVFFEDRDPVEYALTVPGRRTLHQRLGELSDPEPIPPGVGYAYLIE